MNFCIIAHKASLFAFLYLVGSMEPLIVQPLQVAFEVTRNLFQNTRQVGHNS
jgi:hypothetical protein